MTEIHIESDEEYGRMVSAILEAQGLTVLAPEEEVVEAMGLKAGGDVTGEFGLMTLVPKDNMTVAWEYSYSLLSDFEEWQKLDANPGTIDDERDAMHEKLKVVMRCLQGYIDPEDTRHVTNVTL